MKRFITSLTAFVSGMPIFSSSANTGIAEQDVAPLAFPPEPVGLRPLNQPGENMYAGHRSHSSHSSHRSHRSSSGGSSSYRAPSSSTIRSYKSPNSSSSSTNNYSTTPNSLFGGQNSQSTDPGRPALVSPTPSTVAPVPSLTDKEKKKIQIMRVQIALKQLGLYEGKIDGILGPNTRKSITFFQKAKDLTPNGRMTTETLNALGVRAVR